MFRRRRVEKSQGQIINNFFSLVTIVIMSIVITLYSKYVVEPQKEKKKDPLPCQLEIYTKDRITNKELLKNTLTLLENNRFIIDGGLLPSFDKNSTLEQKVKIENIDNMFLSALKQKPVKSNRFLKIKYEIIETDKKKIKKDKNLKDSVAVLQTSFRFNGKEAYMHRTALEDLSSIFIRDRIECTIKAFKYHAN